MADFGAITDFIDDTLTLHAPGRDGTVRAYEIPSPDGATLVRLYAMRELSARRGDGETMNDRDLKRIADLSFTSQIDDTLTPGIVEQMGTDGVPGAVLERAAACALYYFTGDRDTAEMIWSGKAASPSTPSDKDGAAADETSTGSTSGTSTPKKSKRA